MVSNCIFFGPQPFYSYQSTPSDHSKRIYQGGGEISPPLRAQVKYKTSGSEGLKEPKQKKTTKKELNLIKNSSFGIVL